MATIAMEPKPQIHHHHPMTSATVPKLRFFPLSLDLGRFCTRARPILKTRVRVGARASTKALELVVLKENWLDSLSCPFQEQASDLGGIMEREEGSFGRWVLGIDPDVSGAVAVLKDDDDDGSDDASGVSAQVFDTPHLQAMVGKRARKRLDAKSIVQLLHSFGAPLGTTAYIEQSTPFPQDGKQGWWSGGFTYGLWIGILVSSGFSVVPVSSRLWKDQFQLSRNSSRKDDSRKAASDLFPSLSSSLKRKKDHGRAEALLIAAYGKGLRIQSELIATPTDASEPTLSLENCTIGGQN